MKNFAAIILAVTFSVPAFATDPNGEVVKRLARIAVVRAQQQADRDTAEKQQTRNMEAYENEIVPKLQARKEAKRAEDIKQALANSQPRKWVCLGNKPASVARITDYKDDKVTLTRLDGKKFTFTVQKLGKRDRGFVDDFVHTNRL